MKYKESKIKSAKLSKTAKAALPIFALFGGQGFASSRNPLSMQSSRKLAGKSVVYINDTDSPEIPTLGAKVTQQVKSPFAAFTKNAVAKTKNASLDIHSKAMSFLNNNKLLSSTKTIVSNTSGNTESRKTFSDDWQWSTRLPNPVTISSEVSVCAASATLSGLSIDYFVWQQNTADYYICYGYPNQVPPLGAIDLNPANILPQCQAMHMACDQQPLPVELLKFEIE